jgi:D-glycero-alpha-D-manno-heptose-7-phosphate kinase
MLITQTPFRVSFFGGGTDYPEYFETYGGAVLGTAIDKFAYFSMTKFPSALFDYNIRIAYSRIECVNEIDEIQHVPFRECLKASGLTRDVEIDYSAEMPSFSGLGSSSTFTVGLLNTLDAYKYQHVPPIELAYRAIEMERGVIGDSVGCQDQVFAAVGGFNVVEFKTTRDIVVSRVVMNPERMAEFESSLVLVFTGVYRQAKNLAKKQISNVHLNVERLVRMRRMVDRGYDILTGGGLLEEFGLLLDQMWQEKKSLDADIATGGINVLYEKGIAAGALGGKLLGAGGGGFILFYVPQDRRQGFEEKMSCHEIIPIRINAPGSMLIHM